MNIQFIVHFIPAKCRNHFQQIGLLIFVIIFFSVADNHEKMEIATSLVDYLEVEIESIKKCAECYSNEYNYPDTHFTMVCNEPHLIVWAKKKGFNFWPAKLMSIDGQLINVRFFNDHKAEDVPTTNCFLYSHLCPNRQRNSCVSYKSALKVSLYMIIFFFDKIFIDLFNIFKAISIDFQL